VPRYLIDANLPYRFGLWRGADYIHVHDLGEDWPDQQIWSYAREHHLTIVTKDADFSDLSLLDKAPPRVVQLRIGNLRLKALHVFLNRIWPEIEDMLVTHKLVLVYLDRIEGLR